VKQTQLANSVWVISNWKKSREVDTGKLN